MFEVCFIVHNCMILFWGILASGLNVRTIKTGDLAPHFLVASPLPQFAAKSIDIARLQPHLFHIFPYALLWFILPKSNVMLLHIVDPVADENSFLTQSQPAILHGTPQVSPQESLHHRSSPTPITWHNNSQRTYSFRRLPGLSRRSVKKDFNIKYTANQYTNDGKRK